MEVQQDFRDLLALFNAHNVDYIIVGAHALAYHGAPRYTGDMDLLVRPDPENSQRILRALDEFRFGSLDSVAEDFATPGKMIQLGVAPVRVDIVTSITGVTWEDVAAGQVQGKYGDPPVRFIGRKEFILNKQALGRKKDQADLEALGVKRAPANSFSDESLPLDSAKAANCIRRAVRPVSALRVRPFATPFAAGRGRLSVFLLINQKSRSSPVVTSSRRCLLPPYCHVKGQGLSL